MPSLYLYKIYEFSDYKHLFIKILRHISTLDKVREDEYLKGRDNYFTWVQYFNHYCAIEGFLTTDAADALTYATTAASAKSMKKWLHKRIGNGVGRKFFDPSKTIPEISLKENAKGVDVDG